MFFVHIRWIFFQECNEATRYSVDGAARHCNYYWERRGISVVVEKRPLDKRDCCKLVVESDRQIEGCWLLAVRMNGQSGYIFHLDQRRSGQQARRRVLQSARHVRTYLSRGRIKSLSSPSPPPLYLRKRKKNDLLKRRSQLAS